MSQWRAAGPELEAFRVQELATLDPAQNACTAAAFFSHAGNGNSQERETSGLVEQQSIFLRARPK